MQRAVLMRSPDPASQSEGGAPAAGKSRIRARILTAGKFMPLTRGRPARAHCRELHLSTA